jgi:hypothetical protein
MLSFPIVHLQGVSSMKKQLFAAAALIAFASSGIAQDKHIQVTPDALIWKDNPAFPKGVQLATLVGDPTKAGDTVVLRIKFEKRGEPLKPGALWVYPAKHAHYAWTGNEEAILQVQFTGPGGIDYVNPADDPRNK